jgi:hypothetical protein
MKSWTGLIRSGGIQGSHERPCPEGAWANAEDPAKRLRKAVFRRFGDARSSAQGIAFLGDNGLEEMSHRFRPFIRAMGRPPLTTPAAEP